MYPLGLCLFRIQAIAEPSLILSRDRRVTREMMATKPQSTRNAPTTVRPRIGQLTALVFAANI